MRQCCSSILLPSPQPPTSPPPAGLGEHHDVSGWGLGGHSEQMLCLLSWLLWRWKGNSSTPDACFPTCSLPSLPYSARYPISTAQSSHLLQEPSVLVWSCYFLVVNTTFTLMKKQSWSMLTSCESVYRHKEEHWVRKTHLFQFNMFMFYWEVLDLCGTENEAFVSSNFSKLKVKIYEYIKFQDHLFWNI